MKLWWAGLIAVLLVATAACADTSPRAAPPATTSAPTATAATNAALPLRPDADALYVVNSDGSSLRKLFDQAAFDYFEVAPTPDGTRVAVTARTATSNTTTSSKLFLVDVASGDVTEALSFDGGLYLGRGAGWSPDGTRLILSRQRATSPPYFDLTLYTPGVGLSEAIAPAGQVIAWAADSSRFFIVRTYAPPGEDGIFAVDAASLAVQRIVDTPRIEAAVLSPDGRSIAYAAALEANVLNPTHVIDVVGTEVDAASHELARLTGNSLGVYGLAWSPDGRELAYGWAAFPPTEPGRGIYAIDVSTGARRTITQTDQFDVGPRWSPDGRWLLVDRLHCVACDGGAITPVLARADGSSETVIDVGDSGGSEAIWAAGTGARFVYGTDALFSAAAATPEQAIHLTELPASAYGPISWTRGEEIFFTRYAFSWKTALYTAGADGSGLAFEGYGAALSPDGTAIAAIPTDPRSAGAVLVRRGAQSRVFPLPNLGAGPPGYDTTHSTFTWAADSRRLLIVLGQNGVDGLAVLDTDTGELDSLLPPAAVHPPPGAVAPPGIAGAEWSPDGTRVAYTTPDAIWIVDAAGGAPRRVADGTTAAIAWSPDGTQLAVAEHAHVFTVALDGGAVTPLTFEPPDRAVSPDGSRPVALPALPRIVRWSPDGTRLAVGDDGAGGQMLLFALEDRVVQTVAAAQIAGLAWSPDSARLAYGGVCDAAAPRHLGVCIVGRDGGDVTALTDSAYRLHQVLAWRADGTVAFASISTGL